MARTGEEIGGTARLGTPGVRLAGWWVLFCLWRSSETDGTGNGFLFFLGSL